MIAHKHISKAVCALMVLAVCLCLCAAAFSGRIKTYAGTQGLKTEYETTLFETETPLEVNIIMDADDWNDILSNAISEEYKECTVEINGTSFYRVGIRPKGNTSLSSIASDPTTDRYSFKLEFDKYVDGQTCFGLDKLVLNNNYADATNMKEALVYDLFKYVGADASLCNYAKIRVNGEYWGVYLALEAVEDSFLLRNYGLESGKLYKPESMGVGGEKGGGFSAGKNGADLNYTDDETESYSTIWDGAVTIAKKADKNRVVTALKNISEGTDLERYMDIDNLVKYMAVHVFSVNDDSLSGTMAHNYYLYESDGKLNLIPWDYNLAFGGMGGKGNATSVVNDAIDNAFSVTDFFDTLTANGEYNALYYENLEKVVEYIKGGNFEKFYNSVRKRIDSLVKTDPTAFYTYDEYTEAAETFFELVKLRGESIEKQLSGTIPSTAQLQKSSDSLVDASNLNLSVLGSMGGGKDGFNAEKVNALKDENASSNSSESAAKTGDGADTFEPPEFPAGQNGSPPAMPDGEAPNGFPNGSPEDMNPGTQQNNESASAQSTQDESKTTVDSSGTAQSNADSEKNGSEAQTQESTTNETDANAKPGAFPGGDGKGNFPGEKQDSSAFSMKNLAVYGICLAVMLLFLAFAAIYKRRPGKG